MLSPKKRFEVFKLVDLNVILLAQDICGVGIPEMCEGLESRPKWRILFGY
jgi:hypothetical protein